ncbi:MAG: hypothetical protein U1E84_06040 [Rhodoferax sp.]
MKLNKSFGATIWTLLALLAWSDAHALTLGPASGTAFLGRSAKLAVPVQLTSVEEGRQLCAQADVFYGDRKIAAQSVEVRPAVSADSLSAWVHVVAVQPVDEPVVTVFVRAGCEQKLSRRYLLMAEPQRETEGRGAEPLPISRASASRIPANVSETAPQSTLQHLPPAVSTKPASKASQTAREATANGRERVASRDVSSKPSAALRLMAEANLKWSSDFGVTDTQDPNIRLQASQLWRALNQSEPDIAEANQRQLSLLADLRAVQQSIDQQKKLAPLLGAKLEEARSQRYANALVYALLGGCAASMVGWAIWWRRSQGYRRHGPWWREKTDSRHADSLQADSHLPEPTSAFAAIADVPLDKADSGAGGASAQALGQPAVDIHLDDFDAQGTPQQTSAVAIPVVAPIENPPMVVAPVSHHASGHADFVHSTSSGLRSLSTGEMLDIRQQAEFFMTLGQHEQALTLLEDHIQQSSQSNPLVYLDLLNMLHNLGRRPDFERYRGEFNALFAGQVPPYGALSESGNGLERYPNLCDRIVALWPTQDCVAFIEEHLVRHADPTKDNVIDLEAFRDLLLLHGILIRVPHDKGTGRAPFSASREAAEPTPDGTIDFDLSEPAGNLMEFDVSAFLEAEAPQSARGTRSHGTP